MQPRRTFGDLPEQTLKINETFGRGNLIRNVSLKVILQKRHQGFFVAPANRNNASVWGSKPGLCAAHKQRTLSPKKIEGLGESKKKNVGKMRELTTELHGWKWVGNTEQI